MHDIDRLLERGLTRRRLLMASGATLLGAACNPISVPPTTAVPAGTLQPAGTPVPRRGGGIIVGIGGDPGTLNPNLASASDPVWAASGVYSGLVQLNENVEFEPDLAESWTISPDGLQYNFKLRQNVTFHDGTPVTSDDVRYTTEEVAGKYLSSFSSLAGAISTIDTPDAQTIVFNLRAPSAVFMFAWSLGSVEILPKHLYAGTDPLNNPHNLAPIGSGPFKFKEWVKGDHVTLIRNDDYYIPGQPYLDQWITRIIPDASSEVTAFKAGDIDYFGAIYVPRSAYAELAALPGVQVNKQAGQAGNQLLEFNLQRKPFDDLRVRQAIAHAINRQDIVAKAYGGIAAQPAVSHIPADLTHFHDPNTKLPEFNLEKSKQLLDEAGLPAGSDGIRIKTRIAFISSLDPDRLTATVISDQLKDVGIQAELDPYDSSDIAKPVFTDGAFDMVTVGLTSRGDPSIGLDRLYTKAGIGIAFGNGSRYSNDENDALWKQAASTVDENQRRDAFFKIQAILARDLPALPTVDRQQWEFSRPGFSGIFKSPYLYYRPNLVWKTN